MLRTLWSIARAVTFWCLIAFMMLACAASMPSICTNTKSKAYLTAMKSDLRAMVDAQESFRAEHGHYATNVMLTSGAMNTHFKPSTGVHVTIGFVDGRSWRAHATHLRLEGATCEIDSTTTDPPCRIPVDPWSRFMDWMFRGLSPDVWLFAMTFAFRRRASARASRALVPAT